MEIFIYLSYHENHTYSLHLSRNIANNAPKIRTPIDDATNTNNQVSPIPDHSTSVTKIEVQVYDNSCSFRKYDYF